jgi:hypothetical protein
MESRHLFRPAVAPEIERRSACAAGKLTHQLCNPWMSVMSANVASSDDRHYRRQASDYVRPASPLRLDGAMSWDAKTGWENEEVLRRAPLGAELVVEAVPEPGNPHDHTALALDVDGIRVGYMPAAFSARLFPAVVEANKAGFYVLMQAKIRTVRSRQELLVRFSEGADLRAWLLLPQQVRGTTFFELDWMKPGRQIRVPGPDIGGQGRCRRIAAFLLRLRTYGQQRSPGCRYLRGRNPRRTTWALRGQPAGRTRPIS